MRRPLLALLLPAALAACGSSPEAASDPPRRSDDALCPEGAGREDQDEDGLADACEQSLAERYAPIVYHSSDESNFPTNVDAFLALTSLGFHDDSDVGVLSRPSQEDLLRQRIGADRSDGTRSEGKRRTFFLADVPEAARGGSADPSGWTTYVHVYPSEGGGVTLQYWRFYAYNDAMNDHGGDWEGLHVVLDAHGVLSKVRLLGHDDVRELPASGLEREGAHVRVYSEGGGHATRASGDEIRARGCDGPLSCTVDAADPRTFVRQETWPGGTVRFPDGRVARTGPMVNVGSRAHPANGQAFIRYSGLWGSPGTLYSSSGYWGPAFNETGMQDDGFETAWCAGMAGPRGAADVRDECYPAKASP